MPDTPLPTSKSAFLRGMRDCSPFIAVIIPFSTLFGVVARDAGLDLFQIITMSAVVIAGSAQFTAIGLLQEGAPIFIVLLASLAVNMRMAMYSAALVPHLGQASMRLRMLMAYAMVDQTFAVSVKTYEAEPAMPLSDKIRYYFGCVTVISIPWYIFTFLGAFIGQAIPASLSLDFAVPVCFIALIAPMLRSLPYIIAAGVSVTAAIVFADLPWNTGLIVASLLAIVAGAQTEFYLARRLKHGSGTGGATG